MNGGPPVGGVPGGRPGGGPGGGGPSAGAGRSNVLPAPTPESTTPPSGADTDTGAGVGATPSGGSGGEDSGPAIMARTASRVCSPSTNTSVFPCELTLMRPVKRPELDLQDRMKEPGINRIELCYIYMYVIHVHVRMYMYIHVGGLLHVYM